MGSVAYKPQYFDPPPRCHPPGRRLRSMAPSAALSESNKQWALGVVMVVVGLDYAGVGMMRTLLPAVAQKVAGEGWCVASWCGGTATLIGGLETVYGVGQLVGASFMGRLSDSRGRRVVLLLSFAGSAVGYALAAAASSPAMLLLSRLPVGLSKQTVTVSRACAADCTSAGPGRSAAMSMLVAAAGLGYTVGPLLGSWAADRFGPTAPAVAACAIFCALIPTVAAVLPETSPAAMEGAEMVKPADDAVEGGGGAGGWWSAVLSDRTVVLAVASGLLPEFALVMRESATAFLSLPFAAFPRCWLLVFLCRPFADELCCNRRQHHIGLGPRDRSQHPVRARSAGRGHRVPRVGLLGLAAAGPGCSPRLVRRRFDAARGGRLHGRCTAARVWDRGGGCSRPARVRLAGGGGGGG